MAKQSQASKPTLSSMLSARIVNFIPTVALRIIHPLVKHLQLPAVQVDDDSICLVNLRTPAGQEKEVKNTLRVDDRVHIVTPTETLDETVAAHMVLDDKEIYVSWPVSIIFGANVYSRII